VVRQPPISRAFHAHGLSRSSPRFSSCNCGAEANPPAASFPILIVTHTAPWGGAHTQVVRSRQTGRKRSHGDIGRANQLGVRPRNERN
jgi:hypothetical protein